MQLTNGTELKRGDYRIIEVLGQGGFGITYLALQVKLNRKVAIKEFFMKEHCNRDKNSSFVSVPSVGSRELVERFKQKFLKEAGLIASFDNANIIRIHDVFEENGTAYYVMEYLEGKSLKALVDEGGALPEDVAVKYIRQVAGALKEVHENNLLHLDVKPANIMLDKKGNAVLIDFGISKHYDEAGHQTSSAGVGISEGYAPIEQYEAGALKTFTPVTDIYALGATLFFLLTGTRPPKASYINDEGLPPMPETLSLTVRKAVESAMQPRRKDRPQSVKEFIALLENQDVIVGSEETEVASDATNLSMGTGKNASNGNAAVEENEIAVEVVETPSVAPEPAPRPQPEENQKKNKFLWIIILLAVICGALGGFMLLGGSSDVKKDSAKDTVKQIAQKADTPKQDSPLAKETKDTPTTQTNKKDTTAQPQPVAPIPVAEQTTQLKINGAPDGAYVYVDGNYFDETPLKDATISIGEHTIKVVKEGYESYEKKHTFTSQTAPINLTLTAKPKPQPQNKNTINGHEYVDLGLPSGLKWATCNVGASKPEEYGNHYAWGETSTKSSYTKDNSVTYDKNFSDIGGNPTYDVARKQWGSTWRLPTKAEFEELLNENNCSWTWTTQNGINGYKVTSKKNGNSIFLPAAGWRNGTSLYRQGTGGDYWSSTPHESLSLSAYCLYFYSGSHSTQWDGRDNGPSVRPVSGGIENKTEKTSNAKPASNKLSTRTFKVKDVEFTMVAVEGGTFSMGSNDGESHEKPIHQVTLDSYCIGQTEVTQALWQAVMGSNPSYSKGTSNPVVNVSYNDCIDFINQLNTLLKDQLPQGRQFRLPTEAEWEYAARGGNKSKGCKYSGSNSISTVAWYLDNSGGTTHPVKQKAGNELGLYDMSGNVYEWCSDWYGSNYYSSSPQNNPKGPGSGSRRVLRGGCWSNREQYCRSANRYNFAPGNRGGIIGLRLAF